MIPSDLVDQTIERTVLKLLCCTDGLKASLAPAALRNNGNMEANGSEWENGFSSLLGEVVGRRVRKEE